MKITSIVAETTFTPDAIILSTAVAAAFNEMRNLENKNDPNRRDDLYGPYEAVWQARTGTLPPEYFEENDLEPWKLLGDEARRNILWQAMSGCLDFSQEWALIYIQLAIDKSLNDDEFALELAKLNKQFLHSLDHRHGHNSKLHKAMQNQVTHIDCPGCSATAGLLMIDPQIRQQFENELKTLSSLNSHDRMELLKSQGLDKYMNMTIQDERNGRIILTT